MSKVRARNALLDALRPVLDETGLPWTTENGKKHTKVRLRRPPSGEHQGGHPARGEGAARMTMPSVANSGRSGRDANGLWRTPPEATVALIRATRQFIDPVVHEPCCGAGDMARVLEAEGFQVLATDLVDRGYGRSGVDFLTNPIRASSVITNPPFPQAAAFIEHACAQRPRFLALLLKATYWSADKRFDLHQRRPPSLTLPLTWRLDFTGEGGPTMECAWFIWCPLIEPAPPILLRRPTESWGVFA